MATHRAEAGEIVDVAPLGAVLATAKTTALVKAPGFETVRLVVHAGTEIDPHQVPGPITLHCLEGRVLLGLPDAAPELAAGQWVYLEGGTRHSVRGLEDASLLMTIIFPGGGA